MKVIISECLEAIKEHRYRYFNLHRHFIFASKRLERLNKVDNEKLKSLTNDDILDIKTYASNLTESLSKQDIDLDVKHHVDILLKKLITANDKMFPELKDSNNMP